MRTGEGGRAKRFCIVCTCVVKCMKLMINHNIVPINTQLEVCCNIVRL